LEPQQVFENDDFFLGILFVCLTERDRARGGTQAGEVGEGEARRNHQLGNRVPTSPFQEYSDCLIKEDFDSKAAHFGAPGQGRTWMLSPRPYNSQI